MSAPRPQEPEWITTFTDAYERVTGGRYWSRSAPIRPEFRGPALWGQLDPAMEADLRAWWHWVGTRPIPDPATHCPLVPSVDAAFDYDHAVAYSRDIYPRTPPEDGYWRPAWVPLAGDRDSTIVVDTSDPDAPVYQWWLEEGIVAPALGHGVRSYLEFYTALLDAGCFELEDDPDWGVFVLTDAPLPPGVESTHPLIRFVPSR